MSFSSGVKDELSRHQTLARHCQIAEIAAIISMCGGVSISEKDHYSLKIQTENVYVARKYFTLLKKTFNIEADISIRRNAHCILTFDPASEAFYLQPGDGRGLTYLNDALLLTPMQLKAHDLIRTGATTLLFVPLCGESFHWNTYFHKEQK